MPKLAIWLFVRGLKPADVAETFGRHPETVRRYCLPFDDDTRTAPDSATLEKIVDFTGGEVTAADFYPAHLNGERSGDPAVLAGARAS